jgi:hypothetical protein
MFVIPNVHTLLNALLPLLAMVSIFSSIKKPEKMVSVVILLEISADICQFLTKDEISFRVSGIHRYFQQLIFNIMTTRRKEGCQSGLL